MYDELVKRLREHNGWALNETLDEAADAIEATSKAYQMMAEAYEAEVTKPRWIPVTERLPEEAGKYLVCGRWRGKPAETWVCELIVLGKIRGWANEARNPVVTNWMPLPMPPEEET